MPGNERVREFAIFVARLAGLAGGVARQATAELAVSLLLEEVLDARIGTLSHGYRQRVGLLAALLGSPRLLLLDETANGLDPQATAVNAWRNSLGNTLALLNRDFPPDIDVVNLKEAVYTLTFPKEEKTLAEYVAEQLRLDSPTLGKVRVMTREGAPAVQLTYAAPAAQESNLLGQAPFLPDDTLTAAAPSGFLEIQVGE